MKRIITLLLICLTFSSFANRAAIDCENERSGLELTVFFNPSVSLILEGAKYEVILSETDNDDLYQAKKFTVKTNTLFLASLGMTDYPDFSVKLEKQSDGGFYATIDGEKGKAELDCSSIRETGLE